MFDPRQGHRAAPRPAVARTAAAGVLVDVRPDAIVLRSANGEERFALSPRTVAWRGAAVPPAALRPGDQAVVRRAPSRPDGGHAGAPGVAERVWARTGRVSGTIVAVDGAELLVDTGHPAWGTQAVVIDPGSVRQIQVRFPRLAPGYLIDVLGIRHGDYLQAVAPATAQPPYRADHPPAPPASGHAPVRVSGTAVWHEPLWNETAREQSGQLGVGYPALDPETECRSCRHPADGPGCLRLPYLSLGSLVRLRNDCAERTAVLPVTSCAAAARRFCDRCVACGTSPRGRVADLTAVTFVELGGNLEDGCFNATLAMAA